ncbi:MAG: hypothetical protein H7321_09270 [Bacteroidia bacterium]|nr:hypothetical protein [Bacteroidia bacterium]
MEQNQEIKSENTSEQSSTPYTLGMMKMGVSFNPGQRNDVKEIKAFCAKMYDYLDMLSADINFNKFEGMRLKAIAHTFLETFQMNAVKAVTYFDDWLIAETMKWPVGPFAPVDQHPTSGELACTVTFNVGGREDVKTIKVQSAEIYDLMETFGQALENYIQSENNLDRKATHHEQMKKAHDLLSDEEKENSIVNKSMSSVAPPSSPETILKFRKADHARGALGDAFHALRQFQMYAVKAVTR